MEEETIRQKSRGIRSPFASQASPSNKSATTSSSWTAGWSEEHWHCVLEHSSTQLLSPTQRERFSCKRERTSGSYTYTNIGQ